MEKKMLVPLKKEAEQKARKLWKTFMVIKTRAQPIYRLTDFIGLIQLSLSMVKIAAQVNQITSKYIFVNTCQYTLGSAMF